MSLAQQGNPTRAPAPAAAGKSTGRAAARLEQSILQKPDAMPWRDYLFMLLHVGAEIEHALMVQYLYTAYSLGDENLATGTDQDRVRTWRDFMLTVAKEEMGHLLTVQNVLCLLGGPISFDRHDLPWNSPFLPFQFHLMPASTESLSCYVYAEMPDNFAALKAPRPGSRAAEFLRDDKNRILAVVKKLSNGTTTMPVGKIYERIIEIVNNPAWIRDSDFRADTYPVQASWDDWGRGYRPAPARPGGTERPAGSSKTSVIIEQMGTRTEAVEALKRVAEQGEAAHIRSNLAEEESHFDRFVKVYQQFEQYNGRQAVRQVPTNPATSACGNDEDRLITAVSSLAWARLFNVRYRMLLQYLTHTFRLARAADPAAPGLRGAVMHKIFGEMYNLKAIAGILVRSPLKTRADPRRAGPPFEMPYSLTLPLDETDCWRLHRDILDTSVRLCATLKRQADLTPEARNYLQTLYDLDAQSKVWIERLLNGLRPTGSHRK